jgi:tRNA(fMet)-specific endonuclease VapC
MNLAIDTNRYTDLCRGDPDVVALVEQADRVWMPFVVLAELRAGFTLGRRGTANEAVLHRFLAEPGVEVLYAGESTTYHYAGLYRQLRNQGTPIPSSDLWIAALVIEHQLMLATRDRHFASVPQLHTR